MGGELRWRFAEPDGKGKTARYVTYSLDRSRDDGNANCEGFEKRCRKRVEALTACCSDVEKEPAPREEEKIVAVRHRTGILESLVQSHVARRRSDKPGTLEVRISGEQLLGLRPTFLGDLATDNRNGSLCREVSTGIDIERQTWIEDFCPRLIEATIFRNQVRD